MPAVASPLPQELLVTVESEFNRKRDQRDREIEKFKGADGTTLELHEKTIHNRSESKPLEGVTARVEDGAALESRLTVTRMVAFGIFSLAMKKKSGGEKFVTVEGPDFVWIAEADRKQAGEAVKFAAQVNNQAKQQA